MPVDSSLDPDAFMAARTPAVSDTPPIAAPDPDAFMAGRKPTIPAQAPVDIPAIDPRGGGVIPQTQAPAAIPQGLVSRPDQPYYADDGSGPLRQGRQLVPRSDAERQQIGAGQDLGAQIQGGLDRNAFAREVQKNAAPNTIADLTSLGTAAGFEAIGPVASTLSSTAAKQALATAKAGIGAYFTYQMAHGAGEHISNAFDHFKKGDYSGMSDELAIAGAQGAGAAAAIGHTFRSLFPMGNQLFETAPPAPETPPGPSTSTPIAGEQAALPGTGKPYSASPPIEVKAEPQSAPDPDAFMAAQKPAAADPDSFMAARQAAVPAEPEPAKPVSHIAEAPPATPEETPKETPEPAPVEKKTFPEINIPPENLGKMETIKTAAGYRVTVQNAIVPQNWVSGSHDQYGNENERFQDAQTGNQPRDRSTPASIQQMAEIRNNIDPDDLKGYPSPAKGAPVVDPQLFGIAGHGRIGAIQGLYDDAHPNGQLYKQSIEDDAGKYGIKAKFAPEDQPMHVRILRSLPPGISPQQFALDSNEGEAAGMSAPEQAKSDASRLDPDILAQFVHNDEGKIGTPANQDFVRAFADQVVPKSDRNNFMTDDGTLSSSGVNRIRNALFYAAYNDPSTVAKLSEDTDPNIKNVLTGMQQAAPAFAVQRQQIAKGNLHNRDLSGDVAAAAKKLGALRDQKMSVEHYFDQGRLGLDQGDLSPIQKDLLRMFDQNGRSGNRIGEVLTNYIHAVNIAGHPGQGSIFDAPDPPTKAAILDAAIARVRELHSKDKKEPDVKSAVQQSEPNPVKDRAQRPAQRGPAVKRNPEADQNQAGPGRAPSPAAQQRPNPARQNAAVKPSVRAEAQAKIATAIRERDERVAARKAKIEAAVKPGSSTGPEVDPATYQRATSLVREAGVASTSLLQRNLKLGYGAASRVLDKMHADGIIGPPNGSRPRDVLKPQSSAPPIAAESNAAADRAAVKADEQKAAISYQPAKTLDGGKRSIEDSPLFGGDRQKSIFDEKAAPQGWGSVEGSEAPPTPEDEAALRNKTLEGAIAATRNGPEGPVILLNKQGARALGVIFNKNVHGLYINRAAAVDFAKALGKLRGALPTAWGLTPKATRGLNRVLDAIDASIQKSGYALMVELQRGKSARLTTLKHEGVHRDQDAVGAIHFHLGQDWDSDWHNNPLANKAGAALHKMGYPYSQIAAEIGARLISGQIVSLGLTYDESLSLRQAYREAVRNYYGDAAVQGIRGLDEPEEIGDAVYVPDPRRRSSQSPSIGAGPSGGEGVGSLRGVDRQAPGAGQRPGPDYFEERRETVPGGKERHLRPGAEVDVPGPQGDRTPAPGSGGIAEAPLDSQPRLRSRERGSASLEFISGGLSKLLGPEGPKGNYSGLGALQDKLVRNLSQLEKASPKAHTAALESAGSRGQTAVLLRSAVPKIEEALEKNHGPTWDEFRTALVQSRLEGIRQRWEQLAERALQTSDEALSRDMEHGLPTLLQALAGKADIPQEIYQTALSLYQNAGLDRLRKQGEADLYPEATAADKAEHQDAIDAFRDFLSNTFDEAGQSVEHVMTPEDYQRVTGNDGFAKGLDLYKSLIEEPLAQNHAANEGIFSSALGPLKTYYPLIPFGKEESGPAGRRLAYRKPQNIANEFATGISPLGFDTGMTPLGERINKAIRGNTKAATMTALQQEGLLQPIRAGDRRQTMVWRGEEYAASRVEVKPDRVLIANGKVVHRPAEMALVPQWLKAELAPLFEEGATTMPPGRIANLLSKINAFSLAGPLDLVFHARNLIGTMTANTPFAGTDIFSKTIGNTPVTKLFTSLINIANTDPTTPEAIRDMTDMARMGLIPDRYGSETFSKRFAAQTGAHRPMVELGPFSIPKNLGPLLYGPKGLDIRARLQMYRIGKEINPNATPQEMYKFVTQLGGYVRDLESTVERGLKDSGVGPFATAGMTMLRNGINAVRGTSPLPTSSLGWPHQLKYRLYQNLSGGFVALAALWVLAHLALTRKMPWEDPKARLLKLPVPDAYRNSKLGKAIWGNKGGTAYVDMSFFSPMAGRGARALGIEGAFDAHAKGGNAGQMIEGAEKDMMNSALGPLTSGPIVRAGSILATGHDPHITSLRDRGGEFMPQLLDATGPTQAGLPSLGKRGIEAVMSMNSFAGKLGAAAGFGHQAEQTPGANKWLRMATDIAMPGLISAFPQNTNKQRAAMRSQAQAVTRAARKASRR